jgi:DNA-binding response OmpR family regulator
LQNSKIIMKKIHILWVDDEIDLLKPHLIFLETKGYDVMACNNGEDALKLFSTHPFDLVFLDENMPGLSGLEVLSQMKTIKPATPVIMITKSEEEHIMEEAIGSRITDYLIKPVNPNQIILAIKKCLDDKKLISQKTTQDYVQAFRSLTMNISENRNIEDWIVTYKALVHWEMELGKNADPSLLDILVNQKQEANARFSRFIENEYLEWLKMNNDEAPTLSHTLFKKEILPHIKLNTNKPIYWIIIDNLRWDQWKAIQPTFEELFTVQEEKMVCAILPTATTFARNALFAGLMPADIEKLHPHLWVNEDEEGGKNAHEEALFTEQLKRNGLNLKFSYHKITNLLAGKKLNDNLNNYKNHALNIIVYNFVDMLSHARTEMDIIRELADDEAAYRSLTASWFANSPLLEIVKKIAEQGAQIILCTDHGTIKVQNPIQVVGDRNTTTNLRYKQGKNLRYETKDVFEINDPTKARLPRINVSTRYIFATENNFFAYPNNYQYYVSYYRNTFQHGGISMEEMLIPFVRLKPR